MNERFIRIEDVPDFVKDAETNALLNTNLDAFKLRSSEFRDARLGLACTYILKIKPNLSLKGVFFHIF